MKLKEIFESLKDNTFYHGTPTANVPTILNSGLKINQKSVHSRWRADTSDFILSYYNNINPIFLLTTNPIGYNPYTRDGASVIEIKNLDKQFIDIDLPIIQDRLFLKAVNSNSIKFDNYAVDNNYYTRKVEGFYELWEKLRLPNKPKPTLNVLFHFSFSKDDLRENKDIFIDYSLSCTYLKNIPPHLISGHRIVK